MRLCYDILQKYIKIVRKIIKTHIFMILSFLVRVLDFGWEFLRIKNNQTRKKQEKIKNKLDFHKI